MCFQTFPKPLQHSSSNLIFIQYPWMMAGQMTFFIKTKYYSMHMLNFCPSGATIGREEAT